MKKEIAVYNQNGEKVGKVSLKPEIFAVEDKDELLTQVVLAILANQRQAKAKTKTRAEVRGGGKKPWRQKGTGRARAGSIRSPLWRGGGVVFGPTGEENYQKIIPKKMRQLALFYALSNKAKANEIVVLDKIDFPRIKTKQVEEMLNKLPVIEGTFLYVYDKLNPKVFLSMNNLPYFKMVSLNSLNLIDVLNYQWLLLEKETLKKLEEKYTKTKTERKK